MAMLERMKRKVAKAAAASSLPATGARQVDAEIDAALVRSGGAALLERFKAEPRGSLPSEGTGLVNKEKRHVE